MIQVSKPSRDDKLIINMTKSKNKFEYVIDDETSDELVYKKQSYIKPDDFSHLKAYRDKPFFEQNYFALRRIKCPPKEPTLSEAKQDTA